MYYNAGSMSFSRRNFIRPNTITLIPPNGYNVEAGSYKSTRWLKYTAVKQNIYIQHSRIGREMQIQKYKVDGWDLKSNTVYEFKDVFFMGVQNAFQPRVIIL